MADRDALIALAANAEATANDAAKRPGLYETNGHVISHLYRTIANLARALAASKEEG